MHKLWNFSILPPTLCLRYFTRQMSICANKNLSRSAYNETKQAEISVADEKESGRIPQFRTLRWGIAPVSLIGDDFVSALSVLPEENHKVVACAACYKSQANAFAKKHKIPLVYTSFCDFSKCQDIDVVYISALNPFHLEICRMMLDSGKHVVCEKPLCVNQDQAIQLIGHSHSKGLFLMEGIWSRFLPAYQYIRHQIENNIIGEINEIECSFGLPMANVGRVMTRALGGGATLELGVYPIQLAQWCFRRAPYGIEASGELNEDGVDISADICINYGCQRKASISLTTKKQMKNVAIIRGEKGTMTIPDYWCPTKIIDINNHEREFPLPESRILTHFPKRVALCFEAEEVRRCLMHNRNQSEILNHNESLLIANIEDQIRKKLGVVYKEDTF